MDSSQKQPQFMSGVAQVPSAERASTSQSAQSFCDTAAIVRRMIPSTFVMDEKAIKLIDKCVQEFASSVTTIAGGYCALDEINTYQPPNLTTPIPLNRPNELKSEHIMRSIDNLGFVDYAIPLEHYKIVLKGKAPVPRVTQPAVKISRTTTSAADARPAKKAKANTTPITTSAAMAALLRPNQLLGNAIQAASAGTLSTPSTGTSANKSATATTTTVAHGAATSTNAAALTAKRLKEAKNAAIDLDLLTLDPPMTDKDLALKHGVNISTVRNRITILWATRQPLKGLKRPSYVPAVPGKATSSNGSSSSGISSGGTSAAAGGVAPPVAVAGPIASTEALKTASTHPPLPPQPLG